MMYYTPYQMYPYDQFMTQYRDISKEDLWDEMYKIKDQVPQNIIQQYMSQLDYFMEMGMIYSPEQMEIIEKIKDILMEGSSLSAPEAQYVSGTSLLLWFLILSAIWPQNRPTPYPPPRPYPF
ncbi:hypothetical protein [Anaerophilus nitritogenes]|uniref:hypothetical protein n=1 Tax=Anaerophilus nitritogenes TaxID=2498136 RepID=UPI00101E1968|nr:hypothetical protein [Anaerophilus nitritogenes]